MTKEVKWRWFVLVVCVLGALANLVMIAMHAARLRELNTTFATLKRLEKELLDTANKVPGWDKYADLALIHMPPDGHCPRGFELAENIFERDGARYAGCMRPPIGAGGISDVLRPGESIALTFAIPLPRGQRLPKKWDGSGEVRQ